MTVTKPIILTALPVAFDDNSAVSVAGNEAILKKCAASGVDGAFVLGTTGEFPSLSEDERRQLTRQSLDILTNKKVVVHVGAASLYQVVRLINIAREEGAKFVAAITPYFLPSTDDALIDFYSEISKVSDGIGVYVYIFKARTGVTVSPELMAKLAKLPNIIGVKISGETLETVGEYRKLLDPSFEVLTGADREIGRLHTVGANGVISGIASVYPEPFVEMAKALAAGTADRSALQEAVNATVDGLLGDIERLKTGLRLQGIAAGHARMAVGMPDAPTMSLLEDLHNTYGKKAS
jgi:4-hydroxy-tetrahydrodipicolinate synthase